jgi:hypothetical protein
MDNLLHIADGTQTVILRHRETDGDTSISHALIRRFRHRQYSAVKESPTPENHAHWYFALNDNEPEPVSGDEIIEPDETVWTIVEVNHSPLTGLWQCVSQTYRAGFSAEEQVDHLRPAGSGTWIVVADSIPAKFGAVIQTFAEEAHRTMTVYLKQPITALPGDALRTTDQTVWKIERIQTPLHREGWREVLVES